MYVTNCHDMTLVVNVALNPKTTNQSVRILKLQGSYLLVSKLRSYAKVNVKSEDQIRKKKWPLKGH